MRNLFVRLLFVSVLWCKMDFDDLPLLPQVVSLVSDNEDVDVVLTSQHDQTFSMLPFYPEEE